MNWILDIALGLFCVLVLVFYIKRGVKTVFHIITPIASFGLAYLLGPGVGKLVLGERILEMVSGFVEEKLNALAVYVEGAVDIDGLLEQLPESFVKLIESTGTDLATIRESLGGITNATGEDLAALAHTIAESLATSLTAILGCVLVFIAVHLVLSVVAMILSAGAKLPVIKQFDWLVGAVSGVVAAFAYTWLICTVLSFVVEYGLMQQHSELLTAISERSYLYKFFSGLSLDSLINVVK